MAVHLLVGTDPVQASLFETGDDLVRHRLAFSCWRCHDTRIGFLSRIDVPRILSRCRNPSGGSTRSPFNAYSVQEEHRTLAGVCRPNDPSAFRDLTYAFRVGRYANQPITLRNGRYFERSEFGTDWTFALERQDPVDLGGTAGVMLSFFADHVSGSGSATYVLVIRCNRTVSEIVFEAAGEDVVATYAEATLTITHRPWMRIVDVVGDVKQGALNTETVPPTYTHVVQVSDAMIADNIIGQTRSPYRTA